MNTDNKQYIRELIEAGEFNGYTLVSGENWKPPTVDDIAVVRGLIPLTDIRLDVDERTIRKWKTGQTRMVFTTWCCLCWVAGLGMPLDNIISG
ncbi:TPA: korC [Klebsiella pneumoniae]|uniref:korC n=1 Tax=Klebsiella pneumoniae TaxID=573 RepID=UPI0022F3FA97|nr:korC [Klebsiella pneumoniae]WBX45295.1 korC [Klebsiella pneumoniae]HDU1794867.1 korC [Klebsiella pneumoniae]HDU1856999.1 korC [Klebsiella pneumoniae]HDU1980484.1 korC [Klebsiella pneumoniae]HDU2150684.1 korC [Klebsiella pneumoniae]